jgi:hypothetical protein
MHAWVTGYNACMGNATMHAWVMLYYYGISDYRKINYHIIHTGYNACMGKTT